MDSATQSVLRDLIRNDGLTLPAMLDQYGGEYDAWTLRNLYAEVKLEQSVEKIEREADAASYTAPAPVLRPRGLEAMHAGWMRPLTLQFEAPAFRTPRTEDDGLVTLVVSDLHCPDDDRDAVDLFYQIGQALGAQEIVVNGDWFDIASLSRFTPSVEQHLRWVDERQANLRSYGGPVRMRQEFPDARIRFLPGNHDVRPVNWVNANALPLMGMFPLAHWLGIDDPKLGIEMVEDGTIKLAQDALVVKHGTKVSKHAGYSVKKEMDDMGASVIMGHVHRRAMIEVTKLSGDLVGVELGCMCSLQPHYGSREDIVNWQQGFAVVTEYPDGDFEIERVRISQGKAHFRGRRYISRFLAEGA